MNFLPTDQSFPLHDLKMMKVISVLFIVSSLTVISAYDKNIEEFLQELMESQDIGDEMNADLLNEDLVGEEEVFGQGIEEKMKKEKDIMGLPQMYAREEQDTEEGSDHRSYSNRAR